MCYILVETWKLSGPLQSFIFILNKTHKNFEEDEQSDNIAAMLPEEV